MASETSILNLRRNYISKYESSLEITSKLSLIISSIAGVKDKFT